MTLTVDFYSEVVKCNMLFFLIVVAKPCLAFDDCDHEKSISKHIISFFLSIRCNFPSTSWQYQALRSTDWTCMER